MKLSRKHTAIQTRAAQRSAERRRCPKCARKSAMTHDSTHLGVELHLTSLCRFCGHSEVRVVRLDE